MKKAFILSIISFFNISLQAQEDEKNISHRIKNDKGNIDLITFPEESNYKTNNFKEIFKNQLGLKEGSNFEKIKTETDELGFTHDKFQLYHQGIKVEFAIYSLHSKEGILKSMNGEMYALENVNTTATLSKNQAFEIAIKHISAKSYLWEDEVEAKAIDYALPAGELVLLPMIEANVLLWQSNLRLAYKFDIYATVPLSRGDLYIDAVSGEILLYNATIKHARDNKNMINVRNSNYNSHDFIKNKQSFKVLNYEKFIANPITNLVAANAATRYSGTRTIETTNIGSASRPSFALIDWTRVIQVLNSEREPKIANAINFEDQDNNWTASEYNNTNKDNGALDAFWGLEKTYDYFKAVHNRTSFDNQASSIIGHVHYNFDPTNNFNNGNASWNGQRFLFGDGIPQVVDMCVSLDVIGHEFGHAVCDNTAQLVYQKEAGAINEGLSDIWGACVEKFAAPNKSTWLIGEDFNIPFGTIAWRSMSNPKSLALPDTYGGINWINQNCTPLTTNDFCGVHTNSSVFYHWFYILSVGKVGTNDINNTYNVTGITLEKAAKIVYRMETIYLTPNATFASARTAAIQAANDLFGVNSLEVIATTNAFYAVGVGPAYSSVADTVAPTKPLALTASGTTASSTNLNWTASSDNVGVTGYNIYMTTPVGQSLVGSSATTSFTVTGLSGLSNYAFSIKAKDNAGNLSTSSNTVNVTTLQPTYCSSTSNNTNQVRIMKVVLGSINNSSTSSVGYENFTNLSTNLIVGSTNNISITPKWSSVIYPEYYAVWIDYNKNGSFNDTGELVFSRNASTNSIVSGSFTIPNAAIPGATRMRIAIRHNQLPTSCQTLPHGQVEDYTVNIKLPTAAKLNLINDSSTNLKSDNDYVVYPNPVEDILQINTHRQVTPIEFTIINIMGQIVKSGKITSDGADVSELKSGEYFIHLNDGINTTTKKFVKK